METHRRADVETHVFLTSTLNGGKWLASRLSYFNPGKAPTVPIGWEAGWAPDKGDTYIPRAVYGLDVIRCKFHWSSGTYITASLILHPKATMTQCHYRRVINTIVSSKV